VKTCKSFSLDKILPTYKTFINMQLRIIFKSYSHQKDFYYLFIITILLKMSFQYVTI